MTRPVSGKPAGPTIRRRALLAAAAAAASAAGAAALVGSAPAPAAPSPPGTGMGTLPPANLPALLRGVNLTHWFEYEQAQVVPAAELQALRALGFDHVRIPVDPVVGGWQPQALGKRPPAGALVAMPPWLWPVRTAIEAAVAAGLDVVFDLHLTPATRQQIEEQPALEGALVLLWSDIGQALADLPPEHVAFELFNEPQYYGRSGSLRWPVLQAQLLAALRAQAPGHLVLLSGNEGGSLQGLRNLPLVADAAVAYVFHDYEPFLFTHQGAYWLDPQYTTAGLRSNLFYPASAQGSNVPGLSQPHPRAEQELAEYLGTGKGAIPGGSAERVRRDIAAAAALAAERNIRVLCNEFGAIRANVDPPSRYRLLADMRSALEANGIGWTVWDYTDIFGITAESALPPGRLRKLRTVEPAAVQALGLVSGLGSSSGAGSGGGNR